MTSLLVIALAQGGGISFIEENAKIIYPVVGIFAVLVILGGIVFALRTSEFDAERRGQIKGDIVRILRQYAAGLTAESVATHVKLDPFQAAKFLEELVNEGLVIHYTTSARVTTYRLKGL